MKCLSRKLIGIGAVCIFAFGLAQTAGAAGKGYTPGSEGVLAGSAPPPGVHYRQYNVLYSADTLNDANGNKIENGFDLSVFAQAHRFVKITEKKILGADYGFSTIIPVVATDLEIEAAGFQDSEVGLGDIFVEPLVLGWHGSNYDITLGLGFNLPTGDFDSAEPASPGNGYWSSVLTFGGSVFFDSHKSLSASVLTRTIYYGEQDDTDLEPGTEFIVDYGVGKEIPLTEKVLVRPGICGYGLWQVTEDEGPGINDEKGEVYAIGGEVNLFWLPPALFQVNLRTLVEFGAEDESEGVKTVLTLTKSF